MRRTFLLAAGLASAGVLVLTACQPVAVVAQPGPKQAERITASAISVTPTSDATEIAERTAQSAQSLIGDYVAALFAAAPDDLFAMQTLLGYTSATRAAADAVAFNAPRDDGGIIMDVEIGPLEVIDPPAHAADSYSAFLCLYFTDDVGQHWATSYVATFRPDPAAATGTYVVGLDIDRQSRSCGQ